MVKKQNYIFSLAQSSGLLFILLFTVPGTIFGDGYRSKADSIIIQALGNRGIYESYIEEYEAEVYLKGNCFVGKKNFLYRYAPDFLYLDRKGKNSFVESLVHVHFRAPNHFTQQIKAIHGLRIHSADIEERVMQFLNVNIYNPTIFNELVVFPGHNDVFRYYQFDYTEQIDTLGYTIHKIRCKPKIRSQKLLNAYLYIIDKHWTVWKFEARGKMDFFNFQIETMFGLPGEYNFLLPVESKITFDINLLGNKTTNHYYSSYNYQSIIEKEEGKDLPKRGYDLSDYFSVQLDSVPYITDETFWEENRTMPLSSYEKELIENRESNVNDTVFQSSGSKIDFAQGSIAPKRIKYNNSTFSYSGLVNPFKLAYSRNDGIVYWQQFRFRHTWENGKVFSINPNIGFLFKSKEVYFRVPLSLMIKPERFGQINFNFGNKNNNYGYRTQNLINEEIPDSLDFEDLNLDYFRHYNFMLDGRYEISNGLILKTGLDYSIYVPIHSDDVGKVELRTETDEDVIDIVKNRYRAFAPHVSLTWTPGQYYRYIGKRKEYLYSRYPTFSIEYARGIRGIIDSNSDYERLEADIQQKIPIGLMRSFQYYIGGGTFTNTKSFYFADFSLFQKRNFPESWDNPLGGVFHLLPGKWYNASESYVQAHFMYESPFVIFQLFRGITQDILKERFYVSQLYTPELPCYTELGYGVGNYLGNIGIFTSIVKGKFNRFGVKFAFELGR